MLHIGGLYYWKEGLAKVEHVSKATDTWFFIILNAEEFVFRVDTIKPSGLS